MTHNQTIEARGADGHRAVSASGAHTLQPLRQTAPR